MELINKLVEELEKREIPMKKATESQIKNLLSITKNGILPKAYLEFMYTMGNGTDGKYLRGESCFLDEIFTLRQGAISLLGQNKSKLMLTDNDFVFFMSQGCLFCMFQLDKGDNPPVYLYNESGEDRFLKIANTLTEFLIAYLELKPDLFQEKENEDFMSINYSEYKEGVEDLYLQLYQELNTPLKMTGHIIEEEYDYKEYDFLDKCCIFISLAKIAIEDNVDISEIQGELKKIFESNIMDALKEKLKDDFEVFYKDYLAVEQEYKKL